ncbi:hypothetical protein ACOMHN_053106 [Nucella lapillus]
MESEYGRWTIYQLKKELRRRNARVSGRKADLAERLEAYDRNSNFGGDETVQPEYQMQLPPVFDYKDVHAGMSIPALTVDQANDFLSSVGKDLDNKATELYSNKYKELFFSANANVLLEWGPVPTANISSAFCLG